MVASTILTQKPPLYQAVAGLAMLYILQMVVAKFRGSTKIIGALVDNKPLLLMDGSEILEMNLRKAKVTKDDLRAKLRESNVARLNHVKAVVMEATGDVSVLHHENPDHELEDVLLENVQR